jgi:hypothetical protein
VEVDYKTAVRSLRKLDASLLPIVAQDIRAGAQEIVSQARDIVPRRTGNLARNIFVRDVRVTMKNINVSLLADTPYAHIIHSGRRDRPVVIRPKRVSALRWKGQDGKFRYAKYVRLKAGPIRTIGKKFFPRAERKARPVFKKSIGRGITKAWDKAHG